MSRLLRRSHSGDIAVVYSSECYAGYPLPHADWQETSGQLDLDKHTITASGKYKLPVVGVSENTWDPQPDDFDGHVFYPCSGVAQSFAEKVSQLQVKLWP